MFERATKKKLGAKVDGAGKTAKLEAKEAGWNLQHGLHTYRLVIKLG